MAGPLVLEVTVGLGKRVDADVGALVIRTDQPAPYGNDSAPAPWEAERPVSPAGAP